MKIVHFVGFILLDLMCMTDCAMLQNDIYVIDDDAEKNSIFQDLPDLSQEEISPVIISE